ncbi:MAG: T9SS type A sorting domain-containing protein [Bacteroidia bacterium]|nr:T9SS type A sorting domain-containing protein [Bacteroidia bacterium]
MFVGDSTCNYVLLNASVNLAPGSTSAYSYTTGYGIDVDGDFANDVSFKWNINGETSPGVYHKTELTCVSTPSVEFVYQIAPPFCSYTPPNIVTDLPFHTLLKATSNWSNTPNQIIYRNCSGWSSSNYCPYKCAFGNQSSGSYTGYIGFRKILSGDTIYGWAKLKTFVGNTDEIVSYAFRHTATTSSVTPAFTTTLSNLCAGNSTTLSATPSGGFYGGFNVTGNVFSPPSSSPGIYSLFYSTGCANPSVLTITVNPLPSIVFTNSLMSVCNGSTLNLTASPSGGSFTGLGVSGNVFNSSITGLGTATINYGVTNTFGCSYTKSININVLAFPNLTVSATPSETCSGEPVQLTVNGASSYSWSTGANNQIIIINPVANTIYTVMGSFSSGGCPPGVLTYTQTVKPLPVFTVSTSQNTLCVGDAAILSFNGSVYHSWYDSITNQFISGPGSIVVSPTVNTTYKIRMMDSFGCIYYHYFAQKVVSCVGVDEFRLYKSFIYVFPNPNNGEFEIKGIKEETIFVSNELGQLIATKELTHENNYSVKLNNLQSGIYFVGNKFHRQKVVVIK